MDARIIPISIRYIISRDKEKKKDNSRGDILRLLRKNNLEGKWLKNYVNEEQHLPY